MDVDFHEPQSRLSPRTKSTKTVGGFGHPSEWPGSGPQTDYSALSGTAAAAASNPIFECVPSQNGLFVEAPQRQRAIFSPASILLPFASRRTIFPATKYGPLGKT